MLLHCSTRSAFAGLTLAALSLPTFAADMSANISPPLQAIDLISALRTHAEIYLLRAAFDAGDPERISAQLRADRRELETGRADETLFEQTLQAEASYYLVSLRYLNVAGGANWPADRDASAYEADVAERLDALQVALFRDFESGKDVAPVLRELDVINAWTEGELTPSGSLEHFAGLEGLVSDALKD